MNPFDLPLLADENIHPDVVNFLRQDGCDIVSIAEQGKFGLADARVMKQAAQSGRVVLTHDRDFGGLALQGSNFVGIIYVRPGHIDALFTIHTLRAVRERGLDVRPPFILVAERTGEQVKIRIRQM